MTMMQCTPLFLLQLIKKSIEMGKIDNALGLCNDAIKQLEEGEKEDDNQTG